MITRIKVGVRPAATINVSRTSARRGGIVVLSNSIRHFGYVPIRLQRQVAGTWKTVKRFVTSTTGATPLVSLYRRAGRSRTVCAIPPP